MGTLQKNGKVSLFHGKPGKKIKSWMDLGVFVPYFFGNTQIIAYMALHCIQTTIVVNCQIIWEMFPEFQSLEFISFISTPHSRVQVTFHLGGHTNIGPTIRCCDATFLSFPHTYCLLLKKMQVVHRSCFAVRL